jgi:hypothetical protein
METDKTRTITFDEVSAAGDAQQVIVATHGDSIMATRVTAGVRTSQWLGQMSDATLQRLSQDRR